MSILFVGYNLRQQVINNWLKLWLKATNWNPNQLQRGSSHKIALG